MSYPIILASKLEFLVLMVTQCFSMVLFGIIGKFQWWLKTGRDFGAELQIRIWG